MLAALSSSHYVNGLFFFLISASVLAAAGNGY